MICCLLVEGGIRGRDILETIWLNTICVVQDVINILGLFLCKKDCTFCLYLHKSKFCQCLKSWRNRSSEWPIFNSVLESTFEWNGLSEKEKNVEHGLDFYLSVVDWLEADLNVSL